MLTFSSPSPTDVHGSVNDSLVFKVFIPLGVGVNILRPSLNTFTIPIV